MTDIINSINYDYQGCAHCGLIPLRSSHWYIFKLKYPLMIVTEITDSTIHGLEQNSMELIQQRCLLDWEWFLMDCNVHNIFLVIIGKTKIWFLSIQIAVACASFSDRFLVVPHKKLVVGDGSLTELEIMVWHWPLTSNSFLALSISKATFQKAFSAIILRATVDVRVIGISTPSACWKRDYHSIPLPQNLGWKISPVKQLSFLAHFL